MSDPFPPEKVLKLVQMRRNLRGTINAAEIALAGLEEILVLLNPKCKPCLLERGLIDLCTCPKNDSVDNARRRA